MLSSKRLQNNMNIFCCCCPLKAYESQSFIYKQLYTITTKYYLNTYFIGSDGDRTHTLLSVCQTPLPTDPHMQLLYIYIYI